MKLNAIIYGTIHISSVFCVFPSRPSFAFSLASFILNALKFKILSLNRNAVWSTMLHHHHYTSAHRHYTATRKNSNCHCFRREPGTPTVPVQIWTFSSRVKAANNRSSGIPAERDALIPTLGPSDKWWAPNFGSFCSWIIWWIFRIARV